MGQRGSILDVIQTATEQQIENVLLNENVDLTLTDADSRNALHISVVRGRTAVVGLLLKHGNFDIHAKDIQGSTALHLAAFRNDVAIAELLLQNGANIDMQDDGGMTPLHWAVYGKNFECVEFLVKQGANKNILNNKGQTPLDVSKSLKKAHRNKIHAILNPEESLPQSKEPSEQPPQVEMVETNKRDDQIQGLCVMWGIIKYTHPYLGYRKDINWDRALLEAFDSVLKMDKSSDTAFFEIVQKMLLNLKDPNTFIEFKKSGAEESMSVEMDSPEHEKKAQPYVDVVNNVAVIVITDYKQFTKYSQVENLNEAFKYASNSANALVIDIRCLHTEEQVSLSSHSLVLSCIFEEAYRAFLAEDLVLPTRRQTVWNGHPEHRRNPARSFFHGMMVFDAETVLAPVVTKEEASQRLPQKPLTFLINKNTPQHIINIISALQTNKQCTIVYHADPGHLHLTQEGPPLLYEPGVLGAVYDLGSAKVYVRQNEILNSDNTIGFHPDLVLVKGTEMSRFPQILSQTPQHNDLAIRISIALVQKLIPSSKPHVAPVPMYSKRPLDHPYPHIPSLPSPEYRLLALSRLWNAIHYFYPYKNRIQKNTLTILAQSIPKFLEADTEINYILCISDILKDIKDSYAYLKSDTLNDHFGSHFPPILVKSTSKNEVVVSKILFDHIPVEVDLKIGDVIVSVDGENVKERMQRIGKFFSCTEGNEFKDARVLALLLAKESGSVSTLNVRRFTKTLEGSEVRLNTVEKEIELIRNLTSQQLNKPSATVRSFSVLEEKDQADQLIGYIDLRTLSNHNVTAAMEYVKNTQSLILDLRGCTKCAGYRIARYLTSKKVIACHSITPFFMPSLLLEGTESSITQVSSQSCLPDPTHRYSGRIVGLIDNSTVSHAELTTMFLQACEAPLTLIGTPTNGTLGAFTNVVLPGNIEVGFLGLGYTPPNGGNMRRFEPDIVVEETVLGIAEERDEVLERAIKFLQTGN
eukprot:TRINITY_DN13343_c0_g1_i1.p1 TRINITY_DN13343_c0_g1~~TRINITY_DN13343_c0_g1_i1.p1  ORF type:complete len:990 (-),score=244.15 TRINITY_DN13343_c0_g1_i1:37-2976(-)